MNKRILTFILILSGIILFVIPVQADGDPKNKVQVVVLDAGHGGKDPGALGKNSREKDITLSIAHKVGQYIEENFKDVKVIYTRDKDVFIPLHERANIANKNKADLSFQFMQIPLKAPGFMALRLLQWVNIEAIKTLRSQ